MLVGIHLYEGNAEAMRRQEHAVSALSRLKGVEAVNLQFRTAPWASLPTINMMPALVTDSLTVAGPGGKRKPLTRELFDVLARTAAERGHQYFAYINSDILILPAALEAIERQPRETYGISRHDVVRLDGDRSDATVLTSGIDMFVISVAWWERHRRRFRPYVVGDACWDNVYTAVMMCHSHGIILNRDPLILHERHEAVWHDRSATAQYNGFLAALDARYFSLWCHYWDRLQHGRARGPSAADEQALAERVFVWRRSPAAAVQQSIRNVRAHLHFRRLRNEVVAAPRQG